MERQESFVGAEDDVGAACRRQSEVSCCISKSNLESPPSSLFVKCKNERTVPEGFKVLQNYAQGGCANRCNEDEVCCGVHNDETDSPFTYAYSIAGAVTAHFGPLVMSLILQGDLSLSVKVNKNSDMYKLEGEPSMRQILHKYLSGYVTDKYRKITNYVKDKTHVRATSSDALSARFLSEYGQERMEKETRLLSLLTNFADRPFDVFLDDVDLDWDPNGAAPTLSSAARSDKGYVHYIAPRVQDFVTSRIRNVYSPCIRAYLAQEPLSRIYTGGNTELFRWDTRPVNDLIEELRKEDPTLVGVPPKCTTEGFASEACHEAIRDLPTLLERGYADYRRCTENAGEVSKKFWKDEATHLLRAIWFDLTEDLFEFFFVCPLYPDGESHPCKNFMTQTSMVSVERDTDMSHDDGSQITKLGSRLRSDYSQLMRPKNSKTMGHKWGHRTESVDWTVSGIDTMEKISDYNPVYDVYPNDGKFVSGLDEERNPQRILRQSSAVYLQQPGVTDCNVIDSLVGEIIKKDPLLREEAAQTFVDRRRQQLMLFCRLIVSENARSRTRYSDIEGSSEQDDRINPLWGVNKFARRTKCAQFSYESTRFNMKNSCLPSPLVFLFKRYVELFSTDSGIFDVEQRTCESGGHTNECKRKTMEDVSKRVLKNLARFNVELMRLPNMITNPDRFKEVWSRASDDAMKVLTVMEKDEKELKWFHIDAESTLSVSASLARWFGALDEDNESDDPFDLCEDPGADQIVIARASSASSTTDVYLRRDTRGTRFDPTSRRKTISIFQAQEEEGAVVYTVAGGLPFSDVAQASCEISFKSVKCVDISVGLALAPAEIEDDGNSNIFGAEASDSTAETYNLILAKVTRTLSAAQNAIHKIRKEKETSDDDSSARKVWTVLKEAFAATRDETGEAATSLLRKAADASTKMLAKAVKGLAKKVANAMGMESARWSSITLSLENFGDCGGEDENTLTFGSTLDTVHRIQIFTIDPTGRLDKITALTGDALPSITAKAMFYRKKSTSLLFSREGEIPTNISPSVVREAQAGSRMAIRERVVDGRRYVRNMLFGAPQDIVSAPSSPVSQATSASPAAMIGQQTLELPSLVGKTRAADSFVPVHQLGILEGSPDDYASGQRFAIRAPGATYVCAISKMYKEDNIHERLEPPRCSPPRGSSTSGGCSGHTNEKKAEKLEVRLGASDSSSDLFDASALFRRGLYVPDNVGENSVLRIAFVSCASSSSTAMPATRTPLSSDEEKSFVRFKPRDSRSITISMPFSSFENRNADFITLLPVVQREIDNREKTAHFLRERSEKFEPCWTKAMTSEIKMGSKGWTMLPLIVVPQGRVLLIRLAIENVGLSEKKGMKLIPLDVRDDGSFGVKSTPPHYFSVEEQSFTTYGEATVSEDRKVWALSIAKPGNYAILWKPSNELHRGKTATGSVWFGNVESGDVAKKCLSEVPKRTYESAKLCTISNCGPSLAH